jgi:outer membrane protein OmpA-like peptidoglycan-associated protein
MTSRLYFVFVLALALPLLVACGGSDEGDAATVTPAPAPESTGGETAPPPAEPETAMVDPEDVRIEGDHLSIDGTINFASDSDEILEDSNVLLDHIATLLRNHTADISHLRVIGHTDAAGGQEHNQELSERRAAAVVAALQTRGVTTELESSGAGEMEPVCDEDTDDCHARNRRVEFIIVTD